MTLIDQPEVRSDNSLPRHMRIPTANRTIGVRTMAAVAVRLLLGLIASPSLPLARVQPPSMGCSSPSPRIPAAANMVADCALYPLFFSCENPNGEYHNYDEGSDENDIDYQEAADSNISFVREVPGCIALQ